MSKKRLISKGWLRLHIVLSLFSMLIGGLVGVNIYLGETQMTIMLITIPLLYWVAVGSICWVIKGFRDK